MDDQYHISFIDDREGSARGIIGRGLHNFNIEQAGDQHYQLLVFALYAPDAQIVGGVVGDLYWDWLFIELLWIKEELRGCGYGHRLLQSIEDEARKRGATKVHLDTFSFQAPEFYKQHGYRVFGQLDDFPPGHQRLFFTKEL